MTKRNTISRSTQVARILDTVAGQLSRQYRDHLDENYADYERYVIEQIEEREKVGRFGEPSESSDYPKPYRLRNLTPTYPGALRALEILVGVLMDEGPSPKKEEVSIKANPFFPEDQAPLSIYASRLSNPAGVPVQVFEHLSAARLLLPHTVGQNPDFDRGQVLQIIRLIEQEAKTSGVSYTPVTDNQTKPFPQDYNLVLPQGALAPFVVDGRNLGSIRWIWRKNEVQFYIPLDQEDKGEKEAGRKGDSVRKDFVNFVDSLRYQIKRVNPALMPDMDRQVSYGLYAYRELFIHLSAIPIVVNILRGEGEPEDDTKRIKQLKLANTLESCLALWKIGNPSAFGAEQKIERSGLTTAQQDELRFYYEEIQKGEVPNRETLNPRDIVGGGVKSDTLLACYRIYKGLISQYVAVNGYMHGTLGYTETASEFSLVLPEGALPFRIEQNVVSNTVTVWFGTGEDRATKGWAALVKSKLPQYAPKAQKVKKSYTRPAFVGSNRMTPYPESNHDSCIEVIIERRDKEDNDKSTVYDLIRQLENITQRVSLQAQNKPPQDWIEVDTEYIGTASYRPFEGYPLYHIALALRMNVLGQILTDSESVRLGPEILREIATSSPAPVDPSSISSANLDPETKEKQMPRTGAGRISAIKVKSQQTGIELTAPGISPELYDKIKHLIPGPNFKAVKTVSVAGAVGAGEKGTVKKVYRPLPYQKIGIAFIHAAGCRAMIADEMGLGKTIQALGALYIDPSPVTGERMLPALVVCPSSVIGSWIKEVKTWLPHLTVDEWDDNADKVPDVSVIGWTSSGLYWDKLIGRFQTVIVDEAHYGKRLYKESSKNLVRPTLQQILKGGMSRGKNIPYTQRTFGAMITAQSAPHAILLTGTPTENGAKDAPNIWTYLNILDPQRFPDFQQFKREYFGPASPTAPAGKGGTAGGTAGGTPPMDKNGGRRRRGGGSMVFDENVALRLRDLTNEYILRRMKSTVTEQIGLGCFYHPDYQRSDDGCAGSGVEVEIQAGTPGENPPENTDTPPEVYNNPKRRLIRNNCGCGATNNRRNGLGTGGRVIGPAMTGFMKMGVTKEIKYLSITPDKDQLALMEQVNTNMVGVIALAEKRRRITDVVKEIINNNISDLSRINDLIIQVNAAFSDKDAEKIQRVSLATDFYLRSTAGRIKAKQAIAEIYQSLVVDREPLLVWAEQRIVVETIRAALEGESKSSVYDPATGETVEITLENKPFLVDGQKIKYGIITGETPPGKRTDLVEAFQSGKIDLIVCTKAMREGVTLTRANRAVFTEFWWVPAWLMQAEDRIYRIGQTRDSTITYLVLPEQEELSGSSFRVDHMDKRMMDMLKKKRSASAMILGGEVFKTTGEEEDDDAMEDFEDENKAVNEALKNAFSGIAAIIAQSTDEMEITFAEVEAELKKKGVQDTYYSLSRSGENLNIVKEEYNLIAKIKTAQEAIDAIKAAGGSITGNRMNTIYLLIRLRNESKPLTRSGLYDDGYESKEVNAIIKTAREFEDVYKIVKMTGDTKILDAGATNERAVLGHFQQLMADRKEAGNREKAVSFGELFAAFKSATESDMSRSQYETILNKLCQSRAVAGGTVDGLVKKEVRARVFRNGAEESEARKISRILGALTPQVAKKEVQEASRVVMNKTIPAMRRAMRDGRTQDIIDLYADLSDFAEKAQTHKVAIPASVIGVMHEARDMLLASGE